MEITKLILEFVKALVWPVVFMLCALLFRAELRDLFERLTILRTLGGEAEFAARVHEVREASEFTPLPAADDVDQGETGRFVEAESNVREAAASATFDALVRVAEASGSAAILAAWAEVEQRTGELLFREGGHDAARPIRWLTPSSNPVRLLTARGLPEPLPDTIGDLSRLRNEVAHGEQRSVSLKTAVDYIETCKRVAEVLDAFIVLMKAKEAEERRVDAAAVDEAS